MGQVVSLPHHRRAPLIRPPRIDERRREPGDRPTVSGAFALAYAIGVVALLAVAARSI